MSYSVKKKTIELSSGKTVKFDYPIQEAVEVGDIIVVCLDVPTNRKFNENVYALDDQGGLLWQVKPVKHAYERSPYVGVSKAGELARLFNWDGMVYDLNPQTGDIVSSYWGK